MGGGVDGDGEGVAGANHLLCGGDAEDVHTSPSVRLTMQIIGPIVVNGCTSLHFAILEDGGSEFLLDVADAVSRGYKPACERERGT